MAKTPTHRKTQSTRSPRDAKAPPHGGALPLKITNKSYAKLKDLRLFITPELKGKLELKKLKTGGTLYTNLQTRGFQGGKHLLEFLYEKFGRKTAITLTHLPSSCESKEVLINYDDYRDLVGKRFFAIYRETGVKGATEFLQQHLPQAFPPSTEAAIPARKEAKAIFEDLAGSSKQLSPKDQKLVPSKIAALIESQGSDFVFKLLESLNKNSQGGSARLKLAYQEIVSKLAKEPAEAMQELADFMDKWSLLQATSLLSIVTARLDVIEAFEASIHDDSTYELRGDNSIHRILERSMWLVDDRYWIAQSNKSLRTFIGTELEQVDKEYGKKRPDFACVNSSSELVLIEIKRPSIELGEGEVNQAELYLRIVKKYKGDGQRPKIILVGNKISSQARELSELRGYPKLLTYQDLIESCRLRYKNYLDIVEKS